MRNLVSLLLITAVVLFSSCQESMVDESITAGDLKSANSAIKGFDQWGYNWNAHQFNGYLINAMFGDNIDESVEWYHKEPAFDGDLAAYAEAHPEVLNYPFWAYEDMTLVMHWNESCISKEGVYQYPILDSDAWITFHYRMGEGENRWSQFQKFIAASSSDVLVVYFYDEGGNPVYGQWFSVEGDYLGDYYLWPDRILVQVVNTGNVPEGMLAGFKSPISPGIGFYKK